MISTNFGKENYSTLEEAIRDLPAVLNKDCGIEIKSINTEYEEYWNGRDKCQKTKTNQ